MNLTETTSHVETHGLRQRFADRKPEILQLRPLENDGRIHVDDLKTRLRREIAGMLEKLKTVAAFPARIGIREMHPDIACRDRAQNRIGDGMRENIGIGMALKPELGWNRDAAQNQRPPRGNAVNVPALPDSRIQRRAVSCSKNSRARSISLGRVILMLRSLPSTTLIST